MNEEVCKLRAAMKKCGIRVLPRQKRALLAFAEAWLLTRRVVFRDNAYYMMRVKIERFLSERHKAYTRVFWYWAYKCIEIASVSDIMDEITVRIRAATPVFEWWTEREKSIREQSARIEIAELETKAE